MSNKTLHHIIIYVIIYIEFTFPLNQSRTSCLNMYVSFYKLKEKPFNITADPSFFFLSNQHKEALTSLVYGIKERKGISQLTGEVGTGKTTLCRALMNQLGEDVKSAFILNPALSELQLLQSIVLDFGIKTKKISRFEFIWELNKFLLKQASEGKNAVLIIDEAQNLKKHQLEQIRLLSNLETEKEKLLQIILVGQSELQEKLSDQSLRQLKQRISVSSHIDPLEEDEIKEYIGHRLNIAGSEGRLKFHKDTFEIIFNFSKGTPRLINILCDRALLAGFVKETHTLTQEIIQKCIKELHEHNI